MVRKIEHVIAARQKNLREVEERQGSDRYSLDAFFDASTKAGSAGVSGKERPTIVFTARAPRCPRCRKNAESLDGKPMVAPYGFDEYAISINGMPRDEPLHVWRYCERCKGELKADKRVTRSQTDEDHSGAPREELPRLVAVVRHALQLGIDVEDVLGTAIDSRARGLKRGNEKLGVPSMKEYAVWCYEQAIEALNARIAKGTPVWKAAQKTVSESPEGLFGTREKVKSKKALHTIGALKKAAQRSRRKEKGDTTQ